MRVLILWADDHSANLGVRVLAQGAAEVVKDAFGEDSQVICQDFAGTESGVAVTPKSLAMALTSRRSQLAEFVASFDMVFDTGAGDSFTDIYGPKRLAALLGMQRLSRKVGVPHVLGPQTIGPFETSLGRRAARWSLGSNAVATFARDSESLEYAADVGARNLTLATDLVFALPRNPPNQGRDHDVLLNVSGLLWNGSAHLDKAQYRQTVRGLIDGMIETGRGVTLLPHVLNSQYLDNDQPVAEALADEYDGRLNIVVPTSLDHARREISGSRVVIASRMHAALNAVSQGIPAVPLAYSRKFRPLFRDLGLRDSIDLRSSPSEAVISEVLAELAAPETGARAHQERLEAESSRILGGVVRGLRSAMSEAPHA